jgi:integrase
MNLYREEETKLLSGCESKLMLHTVVTLALNTPLRKNEISTLQWDLIDLFRKGLAMDKTNTEGGSSRLIPLNPLAHSAFVTWAGRFPEAKPQDYVFPACQAAGIERQNPANQRIDASNLVKSWWSAGRPACTRSSGAALAGVVIVAVTFLLTNQSCWVILRV